MTISNKKKKWMSIGVGLVGIVTIVGLSDLMFIVPQQQVAVDTTPVATDTPIPFVTTSSTSSQGVTVPLSLTPPTTTSQQQSESVFSSSSAPLVP